MEQQIKVTSGSEEEVSVEILNKLNTAKRVLELLETREVESVEIKYKKRPVLCEGTSSSKLMIDGEEV